MLERERFDVFLDAGGDLAGVAVEIRSDEVGRDGGEESGYLIVAGGDVFVDGRGEGLGECADADCSVRYGRSGD